MTGEIDYERWYPEVPAVMDTKQLAELLSTNEQILRLWVREGILPDSLRESMGAEWRLREKNRKAREQPSGR